MSASLIEAAKRAAAIAAVNAHVKVSNGNWYTVLYKCNERN